ncbi:MAG: hypothetical protein V1701_00045 [Planctomycetota bacterium]
MRKISVCLFAGLFILLGVFILADELSDQWQQTQAELLTGIRCMGGKLGLNPPDVVCDVAHIQKAPKCITCNIILKGYRCRNCASIKCEKCLKRLHLLQRDELNDYKCPCCKSGSLEPAKLLRPDNTCYKCWDKPKDVDVCVKTVYICPSHKFLGSFGQNYRLCKVQCSSEQSRNRKTCGKPVEKFCEDLAEIEYIYICPKCKKEYKEPGKCQEFGCKEASLQKKGRCTKSGDFPHVNESKWESIIMTLSFREEGKLDTDMWANEGK